MIGAEAARAGRDGAARSDRIELFVDRRIGRAKLPTHAAFARWVRAALATRRSAARRQVNVALLGPAQARELNRRDRGRDYATNILSYPHRWRRADEPRLLGDLVICPAVVRREAAAQRKPVRDHFAHLTVHGVLHLLGYDHEDASDAERMEALERRILRGLDIPDPYEAR